MATLFVRSSTTDREERIEEDALLAELSKDGAVTPILSEHEAEPGAILFGRLSKRTPMLGAQAWPRSSDLTCPYWQWDGFLRRAGRPFEVLTYDDARTAVRALASSGKTAFVKATDDKLFASAIPGGDLASHLGDLAYSFIDRPPCLMVQQAVPMQFEYRLLVLDGEIVTGAGVVGRLTPLDNEARFDPKVAVTPRAPEVVSRPELVERYLGFAAEALPTLPQRSMTLDLCLIEDRVAIVECNAMLPGRVGLYACDVRAFAGAVLTFATLLPERHPERFTGFPPASTP